MTEHTPSLPDKCTGEALRELSEPDMVGHGQTPRLTAATTTRAAYVVVVFAVVNRLIRPTRGGRR